ncbi:glucan ABC transporter ATP-binding protein/ permease [Aquamicrobium sp. LC103]|uniref:glucan ABC transporter ATP-binding protein/ permease n=1 Tax=Aquamicrobium sp. LC103 TaxID=1120658 RepID=UPI00063E8486|nr:glucan ABC transporter ATP-binding protein/ permease [Aquamicrobium sp. LC103]TKT82677.1 glucan ABC transporter ATP-binding protein/ permease [Aquamicrobium sp. LC103]
MSLLEIYWRTLRYLAAEKRKVAFICTANVILALITIVEPILLGRVIDTISDGGEIFHTLALWAGLGIFNIVAFVLIARNADRLAHRRRTDVLVESFNNVISMPLAWHHQRGTSNSLHTLLRAVEAMFGLWLEFMRQHLATAVALVLLVPTALSLDVRMSMVLLCLGSLYVAINRFVMRKTKEGQAAVEGHYHQVFAHVSDAVGNVSVLQSYNRVAHETQALKRLTERLISAQYPVLDWWALASALNKLSSTIAMLIVLIIGSVLVSRGELRIGDVIAFTGFATLLISRLDQITGFVNQVFEARAKLEEFFRMEDAIDIRNEPEDAIELGHVTGHVRFENVSFRFPGSHHGVQDVSFDVPAGKTVAIVGPTGAGKTTLINLLQRVFDPDSGRILIDGVDTRSVTRHSVRSHMATVFQDAGLLNRSIEENIRVGRDGAGYEDVHEAARAAAAQDFILAKSEGYDTLVGERGGQLSGGERQRVAIARAILKNAPILVLDEATSALDVETEEQVKQAIDHLRQDRTTFVIAHRLTTVRDADMVVFMDNGRIVEMGGFDELSLRNGRFAGLLRAGGLLNDDEVRRRAHIAAVEAA